MKKRSPIKIILIEDEVEEGSRIGNLLSTAPGIEVNLTHVESLEEAVKILTKEQFDLIFLDLLAIAHQLPTIKLLKSQGTNCGAVVVVAEDEEEELAASCLERGAQDYLLKGEINSRSLVRVIRNAIEKLRCEERLIETERNAILTFQKLSLLREQTPLAVIEWNRELEIEGWNRAAERIFGYGEEEVRGQKLELLVRESDREDLNQIFAEWMEGKGGDRCTTYNLTKENRSIICEWYNTAIIDSGANFIGGTSLVMDISDRVHSYKTLQAREAELRAMFAGITDVVLMINSEGRYLKIAPTNPSLLYKPPTDLVGKTLHEVFPKEAADEFLAKIRRALNCQQPVNYEYSLLIGDRSVWFAAVISPMSADTVIFVSRDITYRVEAELELKRYQEQLEQLVRERTAELEQEIKRRERSQELLREKNAELQAIFDAFPDLFFRLSRDGIILDYKAGNQNAELYVAPSVFMGKAMREVLPPKVAEQFEEARAEVLRSNSLASIEYSLEMSGGEEDYECRIRPFSEGETIALVRNISDRKQAEVALAQERSLLRCLIDSIPDLIFYKDTSGVYQICNQAFAAFVGRPESEIAARTDREIFSAEVAEFFREKDRQMIAEGKQRQNEEWVTYPNGQQRLLDTLKTPFLDANGEILGIIGISRDTTERKKSEEQQQRLALIVENSNDFIGIADMEGNALFVNKAGCRLVGLESQKAVAGKKIPDFMDEKTWELYREVILPGVMEKGLWTGETTLRHFQTGDNVELETNMFLVRDPETNEPLNFATVQRDISDRKRYQAALERERQQLRQVVTYAPIAMAMFDTEMRYLACSDRWLADYNLAGQSVVGRCHYDLFPDIKQDWEPVHQRGLQGEIISNPEDSWEREDGSKVYLRWAIHPWYKPIADGGREVGGIIMVTIGINELVEAREAALEGARQKSQFLANMSHEIRTPMNGVLGMTELLLRTELTAQQIDFVETLRTSGENLLTIINDILDFSKLEAGEMRLDPYPFMLNTVLEDLLDLFALQTNGKGLELVGAIAPEVPRDLYGDASRLRQILLNLIGNAIKFTNSGEVVICITLAEDRATKEDTEAIKVRFAVKDTGIGIPPEGQQKLFRSFSQVDGSTTRQYGGTGLGLAICKELVQLMGGEIGVESVAAEGSTFWFTALFNIDRNAGDTDPKHLPGSAITLTGKRLLIVDDNPTNRKVVRMEATVWGMEVDEAADGATALTAMEVATARGKPYDLALLDMQMPSMSGETLAGLIRSEPAFAETLLIIMTSVDDSDIVGRVREIGCQDYLIKPVKFSQLFDCLTRVMDGEVFPSQIGRNASRRWDTVPSTVGKLETATAPRKNVRVLLVEDTPVNQKVVLNQLRLLNYPADCVNNGREAVEKLEEERYDIILMDCQMPVLDGYRATGAIRELESGDNGHLARSTVIIGLTAYAMKGDREKCLAAGMDDYLTKPVTMEDLARVLEGWFPEEEGGLLPQETGKMPVLRFGGESAVDGDRLSQLCGGDAEFQQEILLSFINDTTRDLAEAKTALAEGDAVTLAGKAHRIKGSSSYIAVRVMPEVAERLEELARKELLEGAQELIAEIELILEGVKAFVSGDLPETGETARAKTRTGKMPGLRFGGDSPVDGDRLSLLSGGDVEFQMELLQAFVEDMEADLAQVSGAIASGDTATVALKAHQIQDSAVNIGVQFIPDLAIKLGELAQKNQLEEIAALAIELQQAVENLKIYILN